MYNIQRNTPSKEMITPENLENTRPAKEYIDAVVANYNKRYQSVFGIDATKARLADVRQNSFKPWEAVVTLEEDIKDGTGKIIKVNRRSTTITRQELNLPILIVERVKGETAYATLQKVTTEAGLEAGELTGNLDLHSNANGATYVVNHMSLNYYGIVNVRFTYKNA